MDFEPALTSFSIIIYSTKFENQFFYEIIKKLINDNLIYHLIYFSFNIFNKNYNLKTNLLN